MDNLINEDNKVFYLLKKGFFPKAVFFSKFDNYFKTIENKNCFLIASKTAYENSSEILKKFLSFSNDDIFFLSGEPSTNDLQDCLNRLNKNKNKYDFILAFGGGSIMDLAKIVKREVSLKLLVIPTTPATGSEVTPYAVLIDDQKNKEVVISYKLLPEVVILDPSLLKTVSKKQMGYFIFDIVSHVIEALFSKSATLMSDALAITSLNLVISSLDNEIDNDNFFDQIQAAGTLGGLVQGMAATGLTHALAHYFGPKYQLSHSKAVFIFLEDVVKLNLGNTNVSKKLNNLNLVTQDKLFSVLEKLIRKFNLERKKIDVGSNFNFEECVEKISKDICILTNPFRPTDEQIKTLIKNHL